MTTVAIVGAQWGDEGKGKIVDVLTPNASYVVRYQGGANAGHTIVVGEEKIVLHLLPSGVLHKGVRCIIGNGVVIDPETCLAEIASLKEAGYLNDDSQLMISGNAHIVMKYHKTIDRLREEQAGAGKIGTTGRGIGPCYEDKVARLGIRFADICDEQRLKERLLQILPQKNLFIERVLGGKGESFEEVYAPLVSLGAQLKRYLCDSTEILYRAITTGQNVLFEGAQGTALDIDHGTYPFVTSSTTVSAGAASGSGVGPTAIKEVIGIAKAYTTRVGSGPFPTELENETGEWLRKNGGEFGATTGRPRRCGWLDLELLRRSKMINGLTGIALTKLDVLGGLEKIFVCVSYDANGKPIYKEFKGWTGDLADCESVASLPENARDYVKFIEDFLEIPIVMISLGPQRGRDIIIKNPFRN